MRFVIAPRGFVLLVIAGLVLLTQNWFPAARALCIILNGAGLAAIALDYFLIPEPGAFDIERRIPKRFFLNRAATVEIAVGYDGRLPVTMELLDRPPESFSHNLQHLSVRLGGGGGEVKVCYDVVPRRRGAVSFATIGVRISSPLRLVSRQYVVSHPQPSAVLPLVRADREGLESLFYVSPIESRTMRTYAPGRDFAQVREYRRGDDLRAIHWKKSARCNRLVVREFEPEQGQNLLLMIDGGRLMMAETGGMSKVDWALSASISLAVEALAKRDSVGAVCFSNDIEAFVPPSNRKRQLSTMVSGIYGFQPRFVEPDYPRAFQWVREAVRQRCILVLFTDFIDPYLSSELAHHIRFLRKKHRVICCAMGNADLVRTGFAEANSLGEAVFAAVVRESLDNRRAVTRQLTREGIEVIDVEPERLAGSVLTSYSRMRWG